MDSARFAGGTSVTSVPTISILPEVASSSPAIRRSRWDLPQPDGPTKTTNSPSSISRSIYGMIVTSPNALWTPFRTIFPMTPAPERRMPSFHGSEGESADQLTLREPAEHEDRRDRHRRRRRQLGPEQTLRARVG